MLISKPGRNDFSFTYYVITSLSFKVKGHAIVIQLFTEKSHEIICNMNFSLFISSVLSEVKRLSYAGGLTLAIKSQITKTATTDQILMCNISRKYPYLPMEGIFFKTSPPLWKFQLIFTHFFNFFGLTEPLTPQEIQIPSVGEYGNFWNLR